jgi:hypothetical protein
MGLVYANIELINSGDLGLYRHQIIEKLDIRHLNLRITIDKNVHNLYISEKIQKQLDLPFLEKRKINFLNSEIKEFDVVGPVIVKFENRQTVCNALILQGENEPLLGYIPLADLDSQITATYR